MQGKIPEHRNPVSRAGWRMFVVVALMFVSPALHAASAQATDEAFAALLSMPSAEPENGRWTFPVPKDFLGPEEASEEDSEAEVEQTTEADLIAYLAKKKREGADFNAYRHFGTLLHHAIRADLMETAAWLLENGADPRKTLKDGNEDALAISMRYKRDDFTRLLENRHGLKPAILGPVNPFAVDPATLPSSKLSASDIAVARQILELTSLSVSNSWNGAQERMTQWTAFVSRLSPDAYVQLLDDDSAISSLIGMYVRSPGDLDKALADLPPGLLERRKNAVAAALAWKAEVRIEETRKGENYLKREYALPVESWRVLWRHTKHPLVYPATDRLPWSEALFLPLAGRIQPELWPDLFASGYADHNAESALGCLLANISASDLETIWIALETSFPNIREVAPRMVLNGFRMPAGNYCWSWARDETRKKLLFLSSLGIKSTVRGIIKRENEPDLLAAMKPFLPDAEAADSPAKPRLVKVEPQCRFTLDDDWYRELVNNAMVDIYDSKLPAETAQLIDIPRETGCGVLLGGSVGAGGSSFDSFYGPQEEASPRCPDPPIVYEVMHNRRGRIERFKTGMDGYYAGSALTPVLDTVTGKRYYLRDEGGGSGMCDGRRRLPALYAWSETAKGLSLEKVVDWELENVLFEQCHLQEDDNNDYDIFCDGIHAPGEKIENLEYQGMDYLTFLKTFGVARYEAYMQAVLALDKPKLRAMQQLGLPGNWTAEAIERVGASSLPLAEKRQRTAWIFYDNKQLARALSSNVLTGLLDWLPREDWRPILRIIEKHGFDVRDLRAKAQEKGLNHLACDLDHAQGLICGGDWSTY